MYILTIKTPTKDCSQHFGSISPNVTLTADLEHQTWSR